MSYFWNAENPAVEVKASFGWVGLHAGHQGGIWDKQVKEKEILFVKAQNYTVFILSLKDFSNSL